MDDEDKDKPNTEITGDVFYDMVGKFCNKDIMKIMHEKWEGK